MTTSQVFGRLFVPSQGRGAIGMSNGWEGFSHFVKPLPTPSHGRESHNSNVFSNLPNSSVGKTNNGRTVKK
jgi:hypothetical protein